MVLGRSAPVAETGIFQRIGHATADRRAHGRSDVAGLGRPDRAGGDRADGGTDGATQRFHLAAGGRDGGVVSSGGEVGSRRHQTHPRLHAGRHDLHPRVAAAVRRCLDAASTTAAVDWSCWFVAVVLATVTVRMSLVVAAVSPTVVTSSRRPSAVTATPSSAASSTTSRWVGELRVMTTVVVAVAGSTLVSRTPVDVREARTGRSRAVCRLVAIVVVPDTAAADSPAAAAVGPLGWRKQVIRHERGVVVAEDLVAGGTHPQQESSGVVVVVTVQRMSDAAVAQRAAATLQLGQHIGVHLGHVIAGNCRRVYVAAGHRLQTHT